MTKKHTTWEDELEVVRKLTEEILDIHDVSVVEWELIDRRFNQLKNNTSQQIKQAKRDERSRIVELWNKHCDEYVPSDEYWADNFAIKLKQKYEETS